MSEQKKLASRVIRPQLKLGDDVCCLLTANDKNNSLDEISSVRFSKRIRDLVKQIAQARGVDESDVIRQAVHQELARLGFLTEVEKKALGQVSENVHPHRIQAQRVRCYTPTSQPRPVVSPSSSSNLNSFVSTADFQWKLRS